MEKKRISNYFLGYQYSDASSIPSLIISLTHSSEHPFFKEKWGGWGGGGVNFNHLPRRGEESEKLGWCVGIRQAGVRGLRDDEGTVWNTLKGGGTEKRGGETKICEVGA